MIIIIKKKITQCFLDLDYRDYNITLDNQTNNYIADYMNNFMSKYSNLEDYSFILDYQDDLLSIINYKLFKNLQSIKYFDFSILGKTKNTKKYLVKKERSFSNRKIKKIDKKIVMIKTYNPLYEVLNIKLRSNKIKKDIEEIESPLERMIPEEIRKTQEFYNVGYIKNDPLCNKSFKNYNQDNLIDDYVKLKPDSGYYNKILCIYLSYRDDDKNVKLLNQIEDSAKLVFYFYDNEKPKILQSQFTRYLKHKYNLPFSEYYNLNNYSLIRELQEIDKINKAYIICDNEDRKKFEHLLFANGIMY